VYAAGAGERTWKMEFQNLPKWKGYATYYIKKAGFPLLKVTIFTETLAIRCRYIIM
jgi:hypothetical protein